jgi:hypothetical protein
MTFHFGRVSALLPDSSNFSHRYVKMIILHLGSAEKAAYNVDGNAIMPVILQVLDTIYVGPVPEGRHMFVFQGGIGVQ